jgi:sensor histidine kinase YesM
MAKTSSIFLWKPMDWVLTLGINMLIAVMLTLIGRCSFLSNFVFSQCIGISVAALLMIGSAYKRRNVPTLGVIVLAVPIGVLIGAGCAFAIMKLFFNEDLVSKLNVSNSISSFALSLLIGIVISFYFIQRNLKEKAEKEIIKQKLKKQETQSALVTTELKLLQAQIEPHFLFNTLSNVISLIEDEPDIAKSMLQSLTLHLRVSLNRTRKTNSVVSDEISLLQAYLSIQKIRMGERLNYSINADDNTLGLPLPALLIQPLVENSIKHGLEKQIDGGEITIKIYKENHKLCMEIADTGKGMDVINSGGIGLTNVETRLKSVYGDSASMIVKENHPSGLKIALTAPIKESL